jgi:hypothetical protein
MSYATLRRSSPETGGSCSITASTSRLWRPAISCETDWSAPPRGSVASLDTSHASRNTCANAPSCESDISQVRRGQTRPTLRSSCDSRASSARSAGDDWHARRIRDSGWFRTESASSLACGDLSEAAGRAERTYAPVGSRSPRNSQSCLIDGVIR